MLWLWHQQSDWFSMQDEKMVDQKRFLTPPLKHGMHKKFINWNFWIANLLFFSVFFFKLLVIEMMTAWIRKGQLFCNFISVKFCCCPWSWTCCHVLQQPYGWWSSGFCLFGPPHSECFIMTKLFTLCSDIFISLNMNVLYWLHFCHWLILLYLWFSYLLTFS